MELMLRKGKVLEDLETIISDLATKGIEFTTAKQIFGQDLKGLMAMVGGGTTVNRTLQPNNLSSLYVHDLKNKGVAFEKKSHPWPSNDFNLSVDEFRELEGANQSAHIEAKHEAKKYSYIEKRTQPRPIGENRPVASTFKDIETAVITYNNAVIENTSKNRKLVIKSICN